MKALVLDAPGVELKMKDSEIPTPAMGEIRLRSRVIGINYGDTMINRIPGFARFLFRVGRIFGARTLPGPHPLVFPCIPGFEAAGIVEETESATVPQGTRVVAFPEGGAYAEYVCVPVERVVRIPDSISFETALSIGLQGITAYDVIHRTARLQRGESVLITAAGGGVGSLGIQLARLAGASQVYGAVSTTKKMEIVQELGAIAVNYMQPGWIQEVKNITDGKGVDVVIDATGGNKFHEALKVTRDGGRLISYGMADIEAGFQKVKVMDLKMRGLTLATYKDNWLEDTTQATWEVLMRLMMNGELKPVVGQQYSFTEKEINHAWQEYGRRSTYGKSLVNLPA